MAPGMKWLLSAVLLCAAVAAFAQRSAPRVGADIDDRITDPAGNRNWNHPLVRRVWQLNDELAASRIVLDEAAAFDSGYARLPDTAAIAVRILPLSTTLPRADLDSTWLAERAATRDSLVGAFQRALQASLATGPSRSRIAIAEVAQQRDSTIPIWLYRDYDAVRFFAGADALGEYCFATTTHVGNLTDSPLGACRLWATYGAPSPAVLDWLARSGHLLEYDSVIARDERDYTHGPHGFVSGAAANTPRRMLFGMRFFDESQDYIGRTAEACLAGREELCLAAALDPDAWRFQPSSARSNALQSRARYSALETIGGFFGDVERELGRERFAQFWTQSREPRADLEAALGADLDQWTRRWLLRHFGPEPFGPRVSAGNALLALLTVGVLLLVSIAVAGRRRIA